MMQVMLTDERHRPMFGVRAVDLATPSDEPEIRAAYPDLYRDRRLYLAGFDTAERRSAWVAGHGLEVVP